MIAVQDAAPRAMLGVATSTSQFFRSIGSAIGVAIMGTVMTQRMHQQVAESGAPETFRGFAENPDVFLQPAARAGLSPEMVHAFQQMLAGALHSVFLAGTAVCLAALVSVIFMPSVRLSSRRRDAA
jgi:hypothetical protein